MHVYALIEALSVTGPAKNLIQFATVSRKLNPPVLLTFLTFRRPHHPSTDPFLDACRAAGIEVKIIPESGPLDLRTLSRLRDVFAGAKPDIVQTHSIKSHFLAWLGGLGKDRAWVAFHHGYTLPTRKQGLYNRLGALAITKARVCVTVTTAFVPELVAVGVKQDRIRVIANAIDPDWYDTAPTGRSGHTKILAIGRLSKEKGHADLVEAISLLGRPCELIVVGEGFERDPLADLAKRKGVNIRFAGQVQDVRPYFAEADLFVLPSHSEGSPNVLIEAMAAGKPIVATSAGGIADAVTDGVHALLVPPATPAALAAAMTRILDDGPLAERLATQAKTRARAEFSPLARAERIAAVYRSLR